MRNLYRVEVIETHAKIYYVPADSEDEAASEWVHYPEVDQSFFGFEDIRVELIEEDYEVPDHG